MKKILFSVFLMVATFLTATLNAQTIFTQWDFNNITAGDITTATPSLGSGSVALIGGVTSPTSGSTGLGSSDQAATNLALQTTTYPAQSELNQSAGVQFNTSTVGYQNIKMMFDIRLSNTAGRWIQVQYTLNGSTWQNLGMPHRVGGMGDDSAGDMWTNGLMFDFSSISGANNNANFGVRILSVFSSNAFTLYFTATNYAANQAYEPARNPSTGTNSNYAGSGTMRYDMVSFEGSDLAPTINATPSSLPAFTQLLGSPSVNQSFTVSASNLTGNLLINAPTGYQISLSSGIGFQSSLSLVPTAGTVPSTTIYVRLNASAEGQFNGNIVLSSNGATNVNVALTGVCSSVPLPTILVNPTGLSGFSQTMGTPSAEQILTVSGQNLTANILVAAPTGYQVSLTSGSGFTNSVTLNQTAGVVNATSVYVRLNHNVVGSLIDNITLSTTGANNVLVSLSGSVEELPAPMLAVTPLALSAFMQNLGFPSATQIVTVGGDELIGNVNITSSSNFFISTSAAGPFSQSISLAPNSGYLDPTQIFVHLNALSAGTSTGVMTVSTAGATSVQIDLNGSSVQSAGPLLYYWHFNTLETPVDVTTINADFSLIPGVIGKFDYTNPVVGQRDMDVFDTGTLLNSQMGEGSGKACRVRNPSTNRTLDFFVPTNNSFGIRFAYAVHRSGQGMQENIISYSINGTDFITTGLNNNTVTLTEIYDIYNFDFSGIAGVNDNPNFRIRIAFNGSTDPVSGNNRFDNFTLTANTYMGIENNDLPVVLVYPNPATDIVQISADVPVSSITVFDLNGRVIMTTNEISFSIDHLNAGMYIVLVETNQGVVQKQIVKN